MGFRQAKGIYVDLDESVSENDVELLVPEDATVEKLVVENKQQTKQEEMVTTEEAGETTEQPKKTKKTAPASASKDKS